MREHFTEETLFKVFKALRRTGLDEDGATNAIAEMQNDGILFREKAPEISHPIATHRGASS